MAEQLRSQLKSMIEQALEAERDYYLQLNYYERAPRCRLDYRNGYYFRDFLTQLGRLAGVRIPRTRKGFRSQVLPRYQRRQAAVNQLIREAFLRGISTRQVSDVLQPVLGETYSAMTISNVTRQLNTAVQQFHRGPLLDEYLYLFLDGIVLKVRDSAGKVRRRMILVAYRVTRAGLRRVLAYQFAQDESQAAWEQFLQDLYLRGLEGKALQLIVSDGGKGLQAALPFIFPHVPVQRCWAHKLRNIADKVSRQEGSCVGQAYAMYRAPSRSAFRDWKQHWQHRRPNAVACVERDLDALLNFFAVPPAYWIKVRTTNVIEHAFREVRRRTRPMSSFSNLESCDRIVYGVISHLNRSWERKPLFKSTQIC
ncbi:MAG TPA: IS256 family transposase [Candidatus Acidoferrum sp.]